MVTKQDTETGIKQREELFMNLYKSCFPAVAHYVSKMGGSFEQAQDVFQDALVIYYEKDRSGTLSVETTNNAYLVGIARHLWLKRHKQDSQTAPWKPSADLATEELLQPSSAKLMRYLESAGKKCMELLRAFYYDNTGLPEIASDFGFSGTRSATVQKFKCLQKVRETIKEKSLSYEDFLE